MPFFKNTNSHRIVVSGNRVQAGAVVKAEGEYADALSATNGVDSSSEKSYNEYQNRNSGDAAVLTGNNGEGVTDALLALGEVTVSGPLQVVVGDNDAPHGPDSGTIMTKDAVHDAADSSLEREAFEPTGATQMKRQAAKGSRVVPPKQIVSPEALLDTSDGDVLGVGSDDADSKPAPKKPAPAKP